MRGSRYLPSWSCLFAMVYTVALIITPVAICLSSHKRGYVSPSLPNPNNTKTVEARAPQPQYTGYPVNITSDPDNYFVNHKPNVEARSPLQFDGFAADDAPGNVNKLPDTHTTTEPSGPEYDGFPPAHTSDDSDNHGDTHKLRLALGLGIGLGVGLPLLAVALGICIARHRRNKKQREAPAPTQERVVEIQP